MSTVQMFLSWAISIMHNGTEARGKQCTLPAVTQRDLSKTITDFFYEVFLFPCIWSLPLRLTAFSIDFSQL